MKNFRVMARMATQVGELLRRRHKLLGWSQEELAHRSGVKQKNISVIENGIEGVRLGTIFRLLAALDLEMSVQQRQKSAPHPLA